MSKTVSSIRNIEVIFWANSVRLAADKSTFYALGKWLSRVNQPKSEPSNIWYQYGSGKKKPSAKTLAAVELFVPGSSKEMGFPLWEILAHEEDIQREAPRLFTRIPPQISRFVLAENFEVVPPSRTRLYEIESYCNFDALACLSLLLRYWHSRKQYDFLYMIACAIYRLLLVLAPYLHSRGVREQLFEFYRNEIFSLVRNCGFIIDVLTEAYIFLSYGLYGHLSALHIIEPPNVKSMKEKIVFLKHHFLGRLPRTLDLEIGPPTSELLEEIFYEKKKRDQIMPSL